MVLKQSGILLIALLLVSCHTQMVQIQKEGYTEAGKVKNNKKIGKWKYSYENGKLYQVGRFKNNLETGSWKVFHPNGSLRQIGKFKNGKIDGLWKFYHENGTLYGSGRVEDGNFKGVWKWFFPNRQIHTIRNYENGKLISVDFAKNFDGHDIDKGTIENGNGTLIIYETQILKDSILEVLNYKDGQIK
ncbi:antitoxin component YwqK of YwqJK toxin-antitoxin module [Flavobacterium sp. 28YEA47A]|uniref:toxin-antitoxin system YwqK family antitoxin n=1 Tax=Flavobacterium sp. 28YEA47A TaxID=3156276 RepID=UPI003516C42F